MTTVCKKHNIAFPQTLQMLLYQLCTFKALWIILFIAALIPVVGTLILCMQEPASTYTVPAILAGINEGP